MTETVETYQNYLGAEVVNDCPVCDTSHFLVGVEMDEDGNGEYVCGEEVVQIHDAEGAS